MATLNLKNKVTEKEDRDKKTATVEKISSFEPQVVLDADTIPYDPSVESEAFEESEEDAVDAAAVGDEKGRKKREKQKKKFKGKKEKASKTMKTPEEAEAYYKKLKIKKIGVLVGIIVFFVAMIAFGTYNTFIKQEKPIGQIAAEVNAINGDTAFPEAGVAGFLSANLSAMVDESSEFSSGAGSACSVSNIFITDIGKKSANIANIYFFADVKTNVGNERWNFFLPVHYDFETSQYSAAGALEITSVLPASDRGSLQENPFLSFEGLERLDQETIDSATTFMDNFFTILYNQKGDISSFYKGDKALVPNVVGTYGSISEMAIYSGQNANGYNAICKYTVSYDNGLTFTNTTYLDLELNGDTWRIVNIM